MNMDNKFNAKVQNLRIALVGSYGNGKTSLANAISKVFDLEVSHASPMKFEDDKKKITLENCTNDELFMLTLQRYTERLNAESQYLSGKGYISDGSIMHEWVYLQTRLENGRFPSHNTTEDGVVSHYLEIACAMSSVSFEFAKNRYHLVVVLPNELKLQDVPPPISEQFRFLLNEKYKIWLSKYNIPYVEVSGSIDARIEKILRHLSKIRN